MRATCDRKGRTCTLIAIAWMLGAWPTPSAAGDDVANAASRARGGAGLRAGTWQVEGLAEPSSGSASESASFEGWFQKGMDLHLALETTMGFWQRTQSSTEPGSLGGEVRTEQQTYLVPMLTALKLYPVTRPASPFEPYLSAGVGAVLGIDRVQISSTDPLVPSGETSGMHTGLGIQAGAGVDWNPTSAFGFTLGGRYQWASFGEDVGGERLYRGPGVTVGLTYRFRYE